MFCSFETQSLEEQFIGVQILLMQCLWYRVSVNLLVLYFTLKPNSKPLQQLVNFILPKLEDIHLMFIERFLPPPKHFSWSRFLY